MLKTGLDLAVHQEENAFDVQLDLLSEDKGLLIYKLSANTDQPTEPKPINIKWKLPSINVKGVWKCGGIHDKRQQYDWELEHLQSRVSVDAPVISVFAHNDNNVITFACSDAINFMEMNALLREEDNHLYCHITFFQERHPAIDNYEAHIRIDTRQCLYSESLQDVSRWWETFEALKPSPVPDLARLQTHYSR